MAVKWSNGRDVQVALEVLRPLVSIQSDGRGITWTDSAVDDTFALLTELTDFDPRLNDHERLEVVQSGVIAAVTQNRWAVQEVLQEIRKKYAAYLRRPILEYRMLSTFSLLPSPKIERVRWGSSTLTLSAELPTRFAIPESAERAKTAVIYGPFPDSYAWLRTTVRERTAHAAFDEALRRADLLRAVWNLFFNYPKGRRFSGGRIRPVNEICWGPLHTLHTPTGKPASKHYWWEPGYVEELRLKTVGPVAERLRNFENAIRSQLSASRYREDLERALVRYVRALDERELATAFTRMWGLLEFVTATLKQKYEITCRRAAFLFRNREYHLIRLDKLTDRRNAVVHTGEDPAESERMLFQTKRYVEEILLFALKHHREFSSLDELGQFLSLPADERILADRVAKSKLALALRS